MLSSARGSKRSLCSENRLPESSSNTKVKQKWKEKHTERSLCSENRLPESVSNTKVKQKNDNDNNYNYGVPGAAGGRKRVPNKKKHER